MVSKVLKICFFCFWQMSLVIKIWFKIYSKKKKKKLKLGDIREYDVSVDKEFT